MKTKWLKWLSLALLPVLLTGCWDSVEINERHVVLEIAVDKNQEMEEDVLEGTRRYMVTYTIPDIGKLSGEDSLAEDVKTAIVTKSSSLATSVDEIESKAQNTITFSHTKALVLGEELLKDRDLFKATMDGLIRDMKIGRGTIVLATKGNAGDLTKVSNPQNPILGLYVMKYFNNAERPASYSKLQTVGNMIKEIQTNGITTIPLASIGEISSKDSGKGAESKPSGQTGTLQLRGAALIKSYELVGWLGKEQVRGQLFVEGQIKEVPIIVDYNGEYLTYNIEQEKSKIKFEEVNGEWQANLEIKVKGNITEYVSSDSNQVFNEASIEEVSKLIQDEINKQIQIAVDYSKEINIDFLNIGLELYRKHPKVWETHKMEWEQGMYQKMPINISTTVTIHSTGMLS